MVTFATAPVRRILISLLAALAMVCGSVVAAQPAFALSFTTDQLRTIAFKVLGLMNSERAAHSVPPLTMSPNLRVSAHNHNLRMAKANTMSHQLAGEPSLGTRITATGYHWRACAENIGWNSDASLNGMYYLQKIMYAEKAPNDGHRRNILNSVYRNVGIDIYYDALHRKMWLTEDFGRLSGT